MHALIGLRPGRAQTRTCRKTLRWLALALLLGLAMGCGDDGLRQAPFVRLNALSPLPNADPQVAPLRVAVSAIISPQGTVASYRPLLDYLGRRLDRPVQLVQRRTYAEVNDLIRRNEVDVAFICTRAYVQGRRAFGMELLAIPVVNGQTVYYSTIIVRADHPAQRFEDLRGAIFAFTDPLSTTGYLYPSVLLRRMGESAESFFQRTFFTYSHDHAIYAVAEGVADAAAVDSLVLDYAVQLDPSLRDRLRVLGRSPAFGIPPVVVGPGIRPQTKALLREALFAMADDVDGRQALQALGVDRFLPGRDQDYDSVRALERELGQQP